MPSSRPTEQERQLFGIDARRRREDNTIRRMQESNRPVFDEICRRFIRGETVAGVATWLWHLKPRGILGRLSFGTLRVHWLEPLRKRLREQLVQRAERQHDPEPPPRPPPSPTASPEVVLQRVDEIVTEATRPREVHVTDDLHLMVDQRVAEVQGLEMLKYIFFSHDNRFREARDLERTTNGMLMPEVTGLGDLMRRVAEAVCKVEFGTNILATKNLHRGINPVGADATAPPKPERDQLIDRFDSLAAVDKNLVREASTKFIDMIREDVGAGFKARGLGRENTPDQQQTSGVSSNR